MHTRGRSDPFDVEMTTSSATLETLLPLVDDLARDLPESERYRRLLAALCSLVPCDASALLRLDGPTLTPLAVQGLTEDALGRRFLIADHPRFAALLASDGPTLFPPDSDLPDPYDGLVAGHAPLDVHDCMGCPLQVDGKPWGLVTLDALDAGRFSPPDLETLRAFASLAAATVSAAERMRGLERTAEQERSRAEGSRLAAGQVPVRRLAGRSSAFRRLLDDIATVAGSDLTVLIRGETGVGKELVAQAIHAASPRADRPLIAVNCAALPEQLIESELFGHVRGAFTDARTDRSGRFEIASGGTLFLDEIGELSAAVQVKLLRVIERYEIERVGSNQTVKVDIRLLTATNRDLEHEVAEKRFREDLFYRLNVV